MQPVKAADDDDAEGANLLKECNQHLYKYGISVWTGELHGAPSEGDACQEDSFIIALDLGSLQEPTIWNPYVAKEYAPARGLRLNRSSKHLHAMMQEGTCYDFVRGFLMSLG